MEEKYLTNESINTWRSLFNSLYQLQQKYACSDWIEGVNKLKLTSDSPPFLEKINTNLHNKIQLTHIAPHLYGNLWFERLSQNFYPISNEIRPFNQLKNAERPDAYHDYMGHVPFLINKDITSAMCEFASFWNLSETNQKKKLIKVWFFMMEFGLFYKNGDTKIEIFGGGILTSFKQLKLIEIINNRMNKTISFPIEITSKCTIFKYSFDKLLSSDIDKQGIPNILFVFRDKEHLLSEFLSASKFLLKE